MSTGFFTDYWRCRIRAYHLLGLPSGCSFKQLMRHLRLGTRQATRHERSQSAALDSTLPNWREGGSIGIGRWRWVVAELERLLAEDDDGGNPGL